MTSRVHAAFLRSPAGSHPERAASVILDLGFQGVILAAPLHETSWNALRAALPRGAIHAIQVFLPWPRGVRPGSDAPFHIAAAHPEERQDAIRQAAETVIAAERASIPVILVPATRMGELAGQGVPLPERARDREERIVRLRAARDAAAKPRLDALFGMLSRMLTAADRYGVAVALAPGGDTDDIPSPEEAAACLDEFRGAPLRIWMDTGARALARSLAPSGYDPFAAIEDEALAGATLRDVAAGGEPAPWGRGIVNWAAEKPLLERCPVWAIDPHGAAERGSLEAGREFMVRLETPPREPSGGILGIG